MRHTRPTRRFRLAAVLTTAVAVSSAVRTTMTMKLPTPPLAHRPLWGPLGRRAPPWRWRRRRRPRRRRRLGPNRRPHSRRDRVSVYLREADFSVVFPSRRIERTQPQQLPDGSVMDLSIAAVETEELFLGTARGQYPEGTALDVPAALQGAEDLAIANVEGTLVAEPRPGAAGPTGPRILGLADRGRSAKHAPAARSLRWSRRSTRTS